MGLFSRRTSQKDLTSREYERIGRALQAVVETGYIDRARLYWVSFSKGLFLGLGTVIGGTIVVAMVLWLLTFFNEIPLVSEVTERIRSSVEAGY